MIMVFRCSTYCISQADICIVQKGQSPVKYRFTVLFKDQKNNWTLHELNILPSSHGTFPKITTLLCHPRFRLIYFSFHEICVLYFYCLPKIVKLLNMNAHVQNVKIIKCLKSPLLCPPHLGFLIKYWPKRMAAKMKSLIQGPVTSVEFAIVVA